MKIFFSSFSRIFILLLSILLQQLTNPVKAQETQKSYLTVSASASRINDYNRGNLDDWWSEQLDMQGEKVDDGSPAFFSFQAGIYQTITSDAFLMGATVGFIKPPDHSIWGSKQVYGYNLVLEPHILSISMPLMFRPIDVKGLYTVISPSLLLGWVTGYYWAPGYDVDIVISPGIGYGLSGSIQYYFTDMLGIDLTLGIRNVEGGLSINNPDSPTGMSIFNLDNGDEVHVDLGGTYMTFGIVGRLPVFQSGSKKK